MSRARATVDVFHAVADPTRRAILERLRSGGVAVTELAAGFDMTRSAVSKHLRVLRDARLVREEKEGRHRVYRLTPGPARSRFPTILWTTVMVVRRVGSDLRPTEPTLARRPATSEPSRPCLQECDRSLDRS